MTGKRLILHMGYHQTGGDLIRDWLDDHAAILAPHLLLYGPDHPRVAALRAAAWDCARGRAEARAALAEAGAALARDIHAQEAPLALLSDADLLGPPLGWVEQGHLETEIYPALCPILTGLAQELADVPPTIAVFERDTDNWLLSLHALAVGRGAFVGDLDAFLAHYEPQVDWIGLREEITFALRGRGGLLTWRFEAEFRHDTVAEMGFFEALEIPQAVIARCRPKLSRPAETASAPTATSATPHAPDVDQASDAQNTQDAPPVLLMGGVNAMAAGGWCHLMRRDYSALVQTHNLSIGAGTTASALYKLLAQGQDSPGAPVIWEQGVNDYSHLVGGQDLGSLLYHVEWLLQLCQRQGRPFVPLLTYTRMQTRLGRDDSYVAGLRGLFAAYGLPVVDMARHIQVLDRGTPQPDRWYAGAFYDTGTDLQQRMAEAALIALDQAAVPQAPPARAARFAALDLRLRTPDHASETLDVAGFPCTFAPFETAPQITTPGRALAMILVTGAHGPVIRLAAQETNLGLYATQIALGAGQPPQQLRQLILGPDGVEIPGGMVQICAETRPAPAPETAPEMPIIQTMFQPDAVPSGAPPDAPSTGLVALLCEEAAI